MRSKSEFFQNLCRKFSGRVAAIDELPKLQGTPELIFEAEEARVRVLTYLAFHRMSFKQEERVMRALFELSDAET